MSDDAVARVHYFANQFLRTEDFAAEQQYHLVMRRRHNIAHHRWGVVAGLRLQSEENQLWLEPGMAIDGYGRELIVPERQQLGVNAFVEKNTDQLGIWLIYRRVAVDPAPRGYAGCGTAGNVPEYRWREHVQVCLDKIDPNYPDMRRPKSVPEGDLDFDPTRTPPDDTVSGWPVFLGTIERIRPNPSDPTSFRYTVASHGPGCPFVGLVGEAIVAPSRRARLQLGAERREDSQRFAVFVKDPGQLQALSAQPSLAVGKDGVTAIRGAAIVRGDLTMAGSAIAFVAGEPRRPQARPWQIYQVVSRRAASAGEPAETRELRIELPGGQDGAQKVVIGAWSADEKAFKPCLTVAGNKQVTVHGDLIVEGVLFENQARSVPKITPQIRALALSTALDTLNQQIIPPATNDLEAVKRLLGSEGGRSQLVKYLEPPTDFGRDFFAALIANAQIRGDLIDGLFQSTQGQQAIKRYLLAHTATFEALVRDLAEDSVGRSTLSTVARENTTLRAAILDTLLTGSNGQQAVREALQKNATALAAVLRDLATTSAGRDAISAVARENTTLRGAILDTLLTSGDGQQAVLAALLKNATALAAVLRDLANKPAGRDAISAAVDDNSTLRGAILDALLTSGDGQQAVREALLKDATALVAVLRGSILTSLLTSSDGQQAVFTALVADVSALDAVIGLLAANGDARAALKRALINDSVALAAVITDIVQSAEGLTTLATVLKEAPTELGSLMRDLAGSDAGQGAIVTAMLGDTSAGQAILTGLLKSPDGRAGFASALSSDPEALAAVVEEVARDPERRATMITPILASEGGPAAIATALLEFDSGPGALQTLLKENIDALRSLLQGVLAEDGARQASTEELLAADQPLVITELLKVAADGTAAALLDNADGRRGLAVGLAAEQARFDELVNLLRTDEFGDLRTRLRDALA